MGIDDRQDLSKFNWDSWIDIDDGSYDVDEEPTTKFGVWSIYTNEFLEIFDTKEEADIAMQEYIENDYDENGYTATAYEVKEV